MRSLLQQRILPVLNSPGLEDAAGLAFPGGELAITTDSFVVSPLFFPGGDIGSLSVFGTVNDLAVAGADALAMTLGLMLEEGLAFDILDRVLRSIADAARACGVAIVAGDTKVVPRGAVDQLFINTTGVGRFRAGNRLHTRGIRIGDALLVSGPIAQHGIAVMAAREGLNLSPLPSSDSASLQQACLGLHAGLGEGLRAMRDATRGGVSAVLHEWALASGNTLHIHEKLLPVAAETRGVCELLGLDPLYVANEGTFLAAVAPEAVEPALEILRAIETSTAAAYIGHVTQRGLSPVTIERMLGILHPLDEPSGAPLPRIC